MAKKDGRAAQHDTPAIRDELFGFLIAGHETSSNTLLWGLKLLTMHQEVQDKLRSSLRGDAGELPSVDEIVQSNIPYLDATIEEIHRLGGVASGNSRVALCDTQILGYHIPKGTDIIMVSALLSGGSVLHVPH